MPFASVPEVELPNGWDPRGYQMPIWGALEAGKLRALEIAHRRWGKDDVGLNWTACAAMRRVGGYWHMLPQAAQARKAIWEAVNPHTGRKRIDEAFPHAIRANTRSTDMHITFINGSTWQVLGSDNYNSLVGSPPVGIVMSEFALANPAAWGYLRPILMENGGWAVFITTPRGRNHAWRLYQAHKNDPAWYTEVCPASKSGRFTAEQLEQERLEYVAEFGDEVGNMLYEQEYNCSFDAAVLGSYYGSIIAKLYAQGRIGNVPWEPSVEVHTFWDLGMDDSTAIWFVQRVGRELRWIDYEEHNGAGLEFYAKLLKEKPYAYGEHLLPHDANVRELGAINGRSRLETLQSLGLRSCRVVPQHSPGDGINAVRQLLQMSWFNEATTERGLDALKMYRREYDEELRIFSQHPVHDWASHGADAARTGAVGLNLTVRSKEIKYPKLGIA